MPKRSAKDRKPRTKAEQRAETLEQILDAAEYLFSKGGLNGVTLRDVAQRVGVHTSLMHYYFVDKRRLFEAVFARRAGITSSRRLDALDRYEREAAESLTVEGALRAFLELVAAPHDLGHRRRATGSDRPLEHRRLHRVDHDEHELLARARRGHG